MAYLSGFSSKRRPTVSSPRDDLRRSKSLGSQAAELAAKLESEQRKSDASNSNVTPPVPPTNSNGQGDQTPKGAPTEASPAESPTPPS